MPMTIDFYKPLPQNMGSSSPNPEMASAIIHWKDLQSLKNPARCR
jgi:hypothetical protein